MGFLHNNFSLCATRDTAQGVMHMLRQQYNMQFSGVSEMKYDPTEIWADGGITLYGYMGTLGDMYPMHIGTKLKNMHGSRTDRLSDLDMTRIIVAFGHETGHLEDMLNYMRKPNDPIGMRLSVETIAANDNQAYYMRNYTKNECEIRAERRGVAFAKDTLTSLMQSGVLAHDGYNSIEKCVDQMLVDYVNFRIDASDNDYFVRPKSPAKKFSELSDVEAAFDEAVERSFSTLRAYPSARRAGIDAFPHVVGIAGQKGHPDYQSYGKMFRSAKSPYEQNLMISAIAAQGFSGDGHGGYFAKWFPALKDELPSYPLTHGVGNANVVTAHYEALCKSMYNAFADAAKRLRQKDPNIEIKMPDRGAAPRIYEDCCSRAAKFHEHLVKTDISQFFKEVVCDFDNKVNRRSVGPEFDIEALNRDPESGRDVSDLSL